MAALEAYEAVCNKVQAPAFLEAAADAQLVWGKVGSYPFWPAQIVPEDAIPNIPALVATKRPKTAVAAVMFFGEYTFGYLSAKALLSWSDGIVKGCHIKSNYLLKDGVREAEAFLAIGTPRIAPASWWTGPPAPLPARLLPPAPAVQAPLHVASQQEFADEDDDAEFVPGSTSGMQRDRAGRERWSARDVLKPLVNRLKQIFPSLSHEATPSSTQDLVDWVESYFGTAINVDPQGLKGYSQFDLLGELFEAVTKRQYTGAQVAACFCGTGAHQYTLNKEALAALDINPEQWKLPLLGVPAAPRRPPAPQSARASVAARRPPRPASAATTAAAASRAPSRQLTDPSALTLQVVNGKVIVPRRWQVATEGGAESNPAATAAALASLPSALTASSLNAPPSYVHVKQNVWVSRPRPKRLPREEAETCNCCPPPFPADWGLLTETPSIAESPVAEAAPAVAAPPPAAAAAEQVVLEATQSMEQQLQVPVAAVAEPDIKMEVETGSEDDASIVRRLVDAIFAPFGEHQPVVAAPPAAVAAVAAPSARVIIAPAAVPATVVSAPVPGVELNSRPKSRQRSGSLPETAATISTRRGGSGRRSSSSSGPLPRDACGEHCLNRLSFIHCDTRTCPAGDRCSNRPFHQLECADMEVFLTQHKGWGVRSKGVIARGSFVAEYAGEIVDELEMRVRMEAMRRRGEPHFYMMELCPGLIIDASPKGTVARLLNSSCDPNCETQKWRDAATGEVRVGIFAIRDIAPGEELCYNYNFQQLFGQDGEYSCRCGAPNCVGNMDARQQQVPNLDRRVEIWWPGDQCYYSGKITGYNLKTRLYTVLYDDGESEKVSLEKEKFRWVDEIVAVDAGDSVPAHASKKQQQHPAVSVLPALEDVLPPPQAVAEPAVKQASITSPCDATPPTGSCSGSDARRRRRSNPVTVSTFGPQQPPLPLFAPPAAEAATSPPAVVAASAGVIVQAPAAAPPAPLAEVPITQSEVAATVEVEPVIEVQVQVVALAADNVVAIAAESQPPSASPSPSRSPSPPPPQEEQQPQQLPEAFRSVVSRLLPAIPAAADLPVGKLRNILLPVLPAVVRQVQLLAVEAETTSRNIPTSTASMRDCTKQQQQLVVDGDDHTAVRDVVERLVNVVANKVEQAAVPPAVLTVRHQQPSAGPPLLTALRLEAATLAGADAAKHFYNVAEHIAALRRLLDAVAKNGNAEILVENPGAQAVAGRFHGNGAGSGASPDRPRRSNAGSVSARGRKRQKKSYGDDFLEDATAFTNQHESTTAAEALHQQEQQQLHDENNNNNNAAAHPQVLSEEDDAPPSPREATMAAAVSDGAAPVAEPAPASVPVTAAAPVAASPVAPTAAPPASIVEVASHAAPAPLAAPPSLACPVATNAAATLPSPPRRVASASALRRAAPTAPSTGLPARTILVAKRLTNSDVTKGRILLPRAAVEANLSFAVGRAHSLTARDHLGQSWEFTLQSWANGVETRRVYVLEHAGDFIRRHVLKLDDVIGISSTDEGIFLVEYNTDEVCAAAETQMAARGNAATPSPLLPCGGLSMSTIPPPPAAANPLIQHNEGRCTRSEHCTKPAGHPGFCLRKPAGSAGARAAPRRPPTQPSVGRPPSSAALPAVSDGGGSGGNGGATVSSYPSGPVTKRRAPLSFDDVGRPKRTRRPSGKVSSYRLDTEEDEASYDEMDDEDDDDDDLGSDDDDLGSQDDDDDDNVGVDGGVQGYNEHHHGNGGGYGGYPGDHLPGHHGLPHLHHHPQDPHHQHHQLVMQQHQQQQLQNQHQDMQHHHTSFTTHGGGKEQLMNDLDAHNHQLHQNHTPHAHHNNHHHMQGLDTSDHHLQGPSSHMREAHLLYHHDVPLGSGVVGVGMAGGGVAPPRPLPPMPTRTASGRAITPPPEPNPSVPPIFVMATDASAPPQMPSHLRSPLRPSMAARQQPLPPAPSLSHALSIGSQGSLPSMPSMHSIHQAPHQTMPGGGSGGGGGVAPSATLPPALPLTVGATGGTNLNGGHTAGAAGGDATTAHPAGTLNGASPLDVAAFLVGSTPPAASAEQLKQQAQAMLQQAEDAVPPLQTVFGAAGGGGGTGGATTPTVPAGNTTTAAAANGSGSGGRSGRLHPVAPPNVPLFGGPPPANAPAAPGQQQQQAAAAEGDVAPSF